VSFWSVVMCSMLLQQMGKERRKWKRNNVNDGWIDG